MRRAPAITWVACAAVTLLGTTALAAPGASPAPSPGVGAVDHPAGHGSDLTFAPGRADRSEQQRPPAERRTPLSDTVVAGGHTLTYSLGGVDAAPEDSGYDGYVRAGATVSFSGSMTYTIGQGGATLLTQSAGLSGTDGVTGYAGELVYGGTYTTPFDLTTTAPRNDGEGVVSSISASVSGRNCNYSGVCGGPSAALSLGVLGTGTDTEPPTIRVLASREPTRIGDQTDVRLRVSDDKGKAKVFAAMFSDGTAVMTGTSKGFVTARGDVLKAWWRYPTGETGPFYECYWTKDKAGNTSEGAPYSSCQWLTIQVPAKVVSNGCGGSAWGEEAVELMNWVGDTRTYGDITVNQRPACNLHDAGYAGATVSLIGSRELIDYRVFSRDEVDQRFAADLASQCRRALSDKALRKECIEETYLYVGLVREYGLEVYDADATTAGTQTVVPIVTTPPGGARDNH